ncbi:SDR family NAD(P)-dependent oxidoreductase [Streptomyces sp. NPDC058583]|uniref:SDR family NAD(P)-dependent oxidoreductase n=1 Tax=unclassified Streptomyces TaxID=2593676 RepID=UPI00365F9A8D
MARVAMVTGAAHGIGADASVRLAEDGMDIAVLGTDEAAHADTLRRITETGRRCVFVTADVADAASVDRALARIHSELGDPAVLLNCVGAVDRGPLRELSDQDWTEAVGGPLRGVFVTGRAVVDPMIKNGGGRILTLADVAGGGRPGAARNSVVETGLAGFTRTIALELRPFGITANVVAPEPTATDLTATPAAAGGSTYAAGALDAVRFLTGDGAAAVSGQIVHVAMTA